VGIVLHISLHSGFLKVGGYRCDEDGTLSEEFQTPVAVAVHLLDPAVSASPMTPAESETKEMEVKNEPQSNRDTGANVSQILDWLRTLTGLIYRLAFSTDVIGDHFSRRNNSSD
jgi:hypothetical protein